MSHRFLHLALISLFCAASVKGQYTYDWSDRLGNGADDFSNAVVADPNYLYVAGSFRGTSVFFGSEFFNSAGLDDAYLAKIEHPFVSGIATIGQALSPFRLYPNPVSGRLHFSLPDSPTQASIVDAAGRIKWSQTLSGPQDLDANFLPSGCYTLVLDLEGERRSRQFTVAR